MLTQCHLFKQLHRGFVKFRSINSKKDEYAKDKKSNQRNSKHGISANHLLNFSLPDRLKDQFNDHQRRRYQTIPRTREEFLQAKFRFVVLPFKDNEFCPSLYDPDEMVKWDQVLLVQFWCHSSYTCPICLDTPRLPRITRCGHIFCWICMLQYLSMDNRKRCPICFDSISKSTLRRVLIQFSNLPFPYVKSVNFIRLIRHRGSVFPGLSVDFQKSIPMISDAHAAYSQISVMTQDYMGEMLSSEMREIDEMRNCASISLEEHLTPYMEEALLNAADQLSQIQRLFDYPSMKLFEHVDDKLSNSQQLQPPYEFFQCVNGEYIILHPFNLRCLREEFKESLPDSIEGVVLEIQRMVMDNQNRKRYRFLSHLPLFSEFYLCEIDLRDYLSKNTRSILKKEIKKREYQRRRRRNHDYNEMILASNAKDVEDVESYEEKFPNCSRQSLDSVLDNEMPFLSVTEEQEVSINEDCQNFARLSENQGDFPTLAVSSETHSGMAVRHDTGVWGKKMDQDGTNINSKKPDKVRRKRGYGKGIRLFSTTQRRSYS